MTIVSHDAENRTHVDGCDDGCYKRDVTNMVASFSQLTALTDASLHNGKGWWVSRDGAKMKYGVALKIRNVIVHVALHKPGCEEESLKCNCDENEG